MKNRFYPWLIASITLTASLALFITPLPTAWTVKTISLWLSAVAGYAGAMLILWLFLTSIRPLARLITPDFAKIMKLHRWLGTWGVVLLFAHPLLLTLGFGESLLYSVVPNFASSYEQAVTLGRVALWLLPVVWISSALLRKQMTRRPWKSLHVAATYPMIFFMLWHIPLSGSSYATSVAARLYFLLLLLMTGIFVLARLYGALNLGRQTYRVTRQRSVVDGIFLLELLPAKSQNALAPKTGQYVYLKLGTTGEDHPFSVLDYDDKTGAISLGYKTYGPFTQKMSQLKPDDTVRLSGSFGEFTAEIDQRNTVFVAGGIGVTPFISRLLDENDQRTQWLFYANKTPATSAFSVPLRQALGKRYQAFYDQEAPAGQTARRMNADDIINTVPNFTECHYFMCGPSQMMSDLKSGLVAAGVPSSRIFIEEFVI